MEWTPEQHVVSGNVCDPEEQAVSVKKEEKAKQVEMGVIND